MLSIEDINQILENHQISQTQLSILTGISQPVLWRNLTGKSNMSLKTYNKIISVLREKKLLNNTNEHYILEESNTEISIAAEDIKGYTKTNDEFLDIIKHQEKTIKNLIDQNDKLTDIIQKLVNKD